MKATQTIKIQFEDIEENIGKIINKKLYQYKALIEVTDEIADKLFQLNNDLHSKEINELLHKHVDIRNQFADW